MSAKTQSASPFKSVPKREFGYHTGQVDEFITAARDAYETESGITSDTVQTKLLIWFVADTEPTRSTKFLNDLKMRCVAPNETNTLSRTVSKRGICG